MWMMAPLFGLSAVATLATTHMGASFVIASITAPFALALAFSTGALTTLNPCGFALLPAYIAYVLRGDEDPPSSEARRQRTDAWSQTVRAGCSGRRSPPDSCSSSSSPAERWPWAAMP